MRRLLALAALLAALPAGAVEIDWVTVGDPHNARDAGGGCVKASARCGSVAGVYRISRYEVTNAQYAEFLNAVADDDPNGLYNPLMGSVAVGGITQSGSPGSHTYAVKGGRANNPVVFVSFYDALRFANWLHNGQPAGPQSPITTEDGAYGFRGVTMVGARKRSARVALPTENEWYKAAYYDPASASFFDYPMGSDAPPMSGAPPGGASSANFYDPVTGYARTGSTTFDGGFNYLTNVGAYSGAPSPYGTFDQGGNVWEWNEAARRGLRSIRGSGWIDVAGDLAASSPVLIGATDESDAVGFRVARVPEPGQALLVLTGALVLAALRRRTSRGGPPRRAVLSWHTGCR